MYTEFYQLRELPFENTPDPRFFYASEQHREALAAIEYAIRLRKGPVLVTGSIGSGKTTIGQAMIHRCRKSANVIQLVHGHAAPNELLGHLLRSLGCAPPPEADHAALLEGIRHQLATQSDMSRPVVIFVDEAQTLSDAALEELRLISNFDTPEARLLQLILIGQPELRDRIAGPAMAPLRQRIVLAKQLRPLNADDTRHYIAHRLRTAAKDPENVAVSFEPAAISLVHHASLGTPRLINSICDNCLLMAYVKQAHRVGQDLVQRVLDDMVPSFEVHDPTIPTLPTAAQDPQDPNRYRLAG